MDTRWCLEALVPLCRRLQLSLSLSLSSFPPRRSLSISLAISLPISPRPNQKMISSRRDESAPLDDSFSLAILVACASISQSSTPPSLWLSSTESVRAALDDYSSLWLSSTPPRLALDRRRLRRPSLAVDASASRSRSSTSLPPFSSCRRLRVSLSIVDGSAVLL